MAAIFFRVIPTYGVLLYAMIINIIHRPEKALDIQSELIFVNRMVHSPKE